MLLYIKVQAAACYIPCESRTEYKMNGLEDGIFMSLLARQEDIAIRWCRFV